MTYTSIDGRAGVDIAELPQHTRIIAETPEGVYRLKVIAPEVRGVIVWAAPLTRGEPAYVVGEDGDGRIAEELPLRLVSWWGRRAMTGRVVRMVVARPVTARVVATATAPERRPSRLIPTAYVRALAGVISAVGGVPSTPPAAVRRAPPPAPARA